MTLLQDTHRTFTVSPSIRSNLFEPQSGQIGQARNPFILEFLWFCI